MFRKNLKHELKQYLRRLWPFAIAVVVNSLLAYILIVNDHNPYEAWGLVMGGFLVILAAIAFVVRCIVHAFIMFYKSLSAYNSDNSVSLTSLLCVQILAFIIIMFIIILFIIASITSFAWRAVAQKFLAFDTEWPYFLEFLFYFIITVCTLYIIPTTWITVFRFSKQKKWPRVLSLIVGIIILHLIFVMIVLEVLLLIHDSSTDMIGLWATTIIFLAIFILVDIGMFLLTYFTLKTSFIRSKPID